MTTAHPNTGLSETSPALRVGYLCSQYPKLSELFIERELTALESRGVAPTVFSLLPGEGAPRQTTIASARGFHLLAANAAEFLRSPVRYLWAAGSVIGPALRAPRELPEAAYVFLLAGAWAEQVRTGNFDHLHAHFAGASTTAAWALSLLTDKSFGFTAHANDLFVRPFALAEKADAARYLVTVTDYNRQHIERTIPGARGKVVTLPTGLPLDALDSRHKPNTVEPPLILAVGRLVPKKGFACLVDALNLLRSRGASFRCLVIGDGPERARLEARASACGLAQHVEFAGAQPNAEVERRLAEASIFALPCTIARDGDRDGLPHSIMEAMAAGVPVVTTRLAGIPELVVHERTGLLVDPDAPDQLADAIGRLLSDPDEARRLADAARIRVREHCSLPRIADRLRELFVSAARRTAFAFSLGAAVLAAPVSAQTEKFPDPGLEQGVKFLRPYSNFGKGDPVVGWQTRFDKGAITITAADRQPLSRVGMRTLPIPLGAGDYVVRIKAKGQGIARSGFYAIVVDANERKLTEQEFIGPGGDFDREFEMVVTVQPTQAKEGTGLIVYAFHDGQGTLTISRLSVTESRDLARLAAPQRKVAPIFHRVSLSEPLFPVSFTPAGEALLPGERRFLMGEGASRHAIEQRPVALAWEMGIEAPTPFWVAPLADDAQVTTGTVVVHRAVGADADGVEPLPPLPADRGLYLFYYGAYRYGKKPRDLERDRRELTRLREDGVTGIGFWDDYGLDFHKFQEGKPMDGAYLVKMAELYRELGFTSPMLYSFFGGLDRGRVGWKSGSEEEMRRYLEAVKPFFVEARAKLGDIPLWACPADEPDDTERQPLAIKLSHLWPEVMPGPMFVTTNWQTARRLAPNTQRMLGAGSLPSFDAARKLGIAASYCSLDANVDPLRYRYISGVYAFASGTPKHAYWHAESIAGKITSDLDGHMPDFIARQSGSDRMTIMYAQALEGLMDLRLLCALEARATAGGPHAAEIAAFLEAIRSSVPPTDRLSAPWDSPGHYQTTFSEARRLWRLASTPAPTQDAGTPKQKE